MGNCLKTQLMGEVSNPNLKKLGIVIWPLQPYSKTNANRLQILGNAPFSIDIVGSGHFYDYQTGNDLGQHLESDSENMISAAMLNNVVDGDMLVINNKYVVKKITTIYTTAEIFKTDGVIDVSYLVDLEQIYFNFDNSVVFNIEELANSKNINNIFFMSNSNVYGSIEKLVEGLIANGRDTTNTLEIKAYSSKVTLNGSSDWCNDYSTHLQALVITFTSTGATCVFNDNTLATYNNGVWTYAE